MFMSRFFQSVIFLTVLFLIVSCIEDSPSQFGFDSKFNSNSKGLTTMYIGNKSLAVYLNGNLKVQSGAVQIMLLNGKNDTIYNAKILASDVVHINENFDASPGFWKLQYKSENGTGDIDLHVFF